jgi:hypothetical protein
MLPSDTYSQPNATDPVLDERTVLNIVQGAIPCFRSRCETRGEAELKAQWS